VFSHRTSTSPQPPHAEHDTQKAPHRGQGHRLDQNCVRMSTAALHGLPRDLRVRSVTDTSMMFMMPIPHHSDTSAIDAGVR